MTNERPLAHVLADRISSATDWYEFDQVTWCNDAANELIRLQAEVERLTAAQPAGPGAQPAEPVGRCRHDGRCQYAIDHGAEGLAACPAGTCFEPTLPTEARVPLTPDAETVALIRECAAAFDEELAAYDIDPPIHHVKQGSEKCHAWLSAHGIKAAGQEGSP